MAEVYRGRKGWLDKPLLTIENDAAYVGVKMFGADPVLTFDGEKIYRGRKGVLDNPMAVVDGDHVYRWPRGFMEDPVATIRGAEVHARKEWGDTPAATVEGGGRMTAACAAVYLFLM